VTDRPQRPATGWRRPWLALPGDPIVPFLPLATAQKVGLPVGLVVAAEAVFRGAALSFGGEVISRYRRFFEARTWRRKG
jgi:hypothetical protein